MKKSHFMSQVELDAGYRVYYTKKADEIIILLVGGDKSTQRKI